VKQPGVNLHIKQYVEFDDWRSNDKKKEGRKIMNILYGCCVRCPLVTSHKHYTCIGKMKKRKGKIQDHIYCKAAGDGRDLEKVECEIFMKDVACLPSTTNFIIHF